MVCQEVDTFLAEVFGGGGWGPIPIPSGEGVEDLAGSGLAWVLPMLEHPMATDQYRTIRMEWPPIHSKRWAT